MNPPQDVRGLVQMWSRTRAFARDAGVAAPLVRQWMHRGTIPPRYWRGIVKGALVRGIPVTIDTLLDVAAGKRT